MDVNRLLSDELTYELSVRGLPVGKTVAEKRTTLREAMKTEKRTGERKSIQIALNVATELEICEGKITDLEEAIVQFNDENKDNEFSRIYSRLLHLSLRLGRIQGRNVDEEIARLELVNRCSQLIGDLNLVMEGLEISIGAKQTNIEEQLRKESRLERRDESVVSGLEADLGAGRSILDEENSPIHEEVLHPTVSYDLIQLEENRNTVSSVQSGQTRRLPQDRVEPNRSGKASFLTGISSPLGAVEKSLTPRVRFVEENWSRQAEPSNLAEWVEPLTLGSEVGRDVDISRPGFSNFGHSTSCEPTSSKWSDNRQAHAGDDFRFFDITKWNLRYNGRSSVNDFLERIEELRISRGISQHQLLKSAPELFTEDALLWLRTNTFKTWNELVSKLRDDFRPYDYEYSLWDEIRKRTQGAQEKVLTFVTAMENLFRRLEQPPPEETRVTIIRRNLLPIIQTQLALHPIRTLHELIRLGRTIEETESRVQKFAPPSTNYRSLLEPELAYRKPTLTQSAPSRVSLVETSSTSRSYSKTEAALNPQFSSSSRNQSPLCWNCSASSHKFRSCPEPRKKFCYRCGYGNVFADACPNCSKNLKRGQR